MIQPNLIVEYITSLPGVSVAHPFGDSVSVFIMPGPGKTDVERMFALVEDGSSPLKLSLRCDPILAKNLRQRYEEVQPGQNLDRNHWNTIVCSGQLMLDEIQDLIRHSYLLTAEPDSKKP